MLHRRRKKRTCVYGRSRLLIYGNFHTQIDPDQFIYSSIDRQRYVALTPLALAGTGLGVYIMLHSSIEIP
jgi:hypothetical protein